MNLEETLAHQIAHGIETDGDVHIPAGLPKAIIASTDRRIAQALYIFGAWLTTRDQIETFSAMHDATPMAELISLFCEHNKIPEAGNAKDWPFEPPKEAPVKLDIHILLDALVADHLDPETIATIEQIAESRGRPLSKDESTRLYLAEPARELKEVK